MATKATLKSIAKMMKGIDLCMLTTSDARGASSSRPMSNNGDVDYDGKSYFFTKNDSRMVREIKKNAKVSLQFADHRVLRRKSFISVNGKATLITDRAEMEPHWNKDLEIWFKDGLDTKGITMIEVAADHIKYWSGGDEGEYKPSKGGARKRRSH